MCFYTKGSKIKIAKEDIICYKTVKRSSNSYFSEYRKFNYECNKEYSGKLKLKLFLKWLFNLDITEEAYHSYTYISGGLTVKCIISKGSLYLTDYHNLEYCSTSIIIKKEVDFKNLLKDKLEKLEEKINNFKTE